jgi:hypothetical protein
MSKWLTAGVIVRDPGGQLTFLSTGTELPVWADGLVGDHVLSDRSPFGAAEQGNVEEPPRQDDQQVSDEPPARRGGGSGRTAWAEYATRHGVHVDSDDTRGDIIAACEQAGLPT